MQNKIVEVTYNWPAETFIERHINALQAIGLPVQVVARHRKSLQGDSASLNDESANSAAYILPNFDHLNAPEKIWSTRHLTSASIRLRRGWGERVLLGYFERLRPALIHFHDASLASFMRWIPQRLGIPYTLSVRGSDIQVLPAQSTARHSETVAALRDARKIHAVCQQLGELAQRLAGTPLDVQTIYTTVPFPAQLGERPAVSPGAPLHFVCSGRLMWRKGFAQLLIAFRGLLDQGLQARLTIIGIGPDLDMILYLRKTLALEGCVSLVGKLSYPEIVRVFGSAHAYIQSSVAEGLSNALVEAIANGLPVFATHVDGTAEIVQDGVTGLLLPPLQPAAWPAVLAQVSDTALMQRMRTAAYEKARDMFSAERHARDFSTFFNAALQTEQA